MFDVLREEYFGLPGWLWIVLVAGAAYVLWPKGDEPSSPQAGAQEARQPKGRKGRGR